MCGNHRSNNIKIAEVTSDASYAIALTACKIFAKTKHSSSWTVIAPPCHSYANMKTVYLFVLFLLI